MPTSISSTAVNRRGRIAATFVSALIGLAAFMAMSPGTAQATPQWNDIHEWDVSPQPFHYTPEPPTNFVRTKTDAGTITLNLTNNVTGGICVLLLRAANGSRLGLGCWLPNERGPKTLATNVPPQRFTVWAARRGNAPTTDDARWDGRLYY